MNKKINDFSKAKVGDSFMCQNGSVLEVVFIQNDTYCCSLNGELFLHDSEGKMIEFVNNFCWENFVRFVTNNKDEL